MERDEIVSWLRYGHARTAGLVAAMRLGLFDRLARQPVDPATLARECGTTPHATRVLTQFLHAAGVLVTQAPDTFTTAPDVTGPVRVELAGAATDASSSWSVVGDAAALLRRGTTTEVSRAFARLTPGPAGALTGAAWALDVGHQGYLRARCLSVGVELGLLSALRDGPRPAGRLAASLDLDRAGAEVALDGLHRLGVCDLTAEGYRLRPAAAALLATDRSASAFELAAGLAHHFWTALGGLDEVARTGRLTFDLQDPATANRYYLLLARYNSLVFPGYLRLAQSVAAALGERVTAPEAAVVDVGAGSGVWAAAFARAWPTCWVRLLDRGPVLAQARANLSRVGVADRSTFDEIDLATDPFGDGTADVVVLGQICHTQPESTLPHLLRRCADALRPGGVLLIADSVLEDSGASPARYLDFALKELVGTGGAVLTEAGYRWLLAGAGFGDVTMRRFAELDVFVAVSGPPPADALAAGRPAAALEVTP